MITYNEDDDACSFLLNYGFWMQERDDSIRIYFRVDFDPASLSPSQPLWAAIKSLGLEPSPDMGLAATKASPLPGTWIWLLRLKGMNDDQRRNFAAGRVEVPASVEAEAWRTIRSTLDEQYQWYDKYNELDTGVTGSAGAKVSTEGEKSVADLARRVRAAAVEVISSAIEQIPDAVD